MAIPGIPLMAPGAILVLMLIIIKAVPSFEKPPPLLLWVYKSDGLYFVASPILITLYVILIVLCLPRAHS